MVIIIIIKIIMEKAINEPSDLKILKKIQKNNFRSQ